MRTLRRTLIVAITLLAVACTGGGSDTTPAPAPSTPSGGAPVTSNTEVRFVPGQFHYMFGRVNASLSMKGSEATLEITNTTGGQLGPPGVYAITGDGQRYDGTVAEAAAVPDGATVTVAVTFPDAVTAQNVGLMVLTMGPATLGAMPPVPLP